MTTATGGCIFDPPNNNNTPDPMKNNTATARLFAHVMTAKITDDYTYESPNGRDLVTITERELDVEFNREAVILFRQCKAAQRAAGDLRTNVLIGDTQIALRSDSTRQVLLIITRTVRSFAELAN